MTKPDPQVHQPTEGASERARAHPDPIPCTVRAHRFTPQRSGHRHYPARCRATASRQRDADRLNALLDRLRPDDPGRPE